MMSFVSRLCRRHSSSFLWKHGQSWGVAEIPDRTLLEATGKDAWKFLQGILANDLRRLTPQKTIIFSAVLNVEGRVVADVIVHAVGSWTDHKDETRIKSVKPLPPVAQPEKFVLEVPTQSSAALLAMFKKLLLFSVVEFKDITSTTQLLAVLPPSADPNIDIQSTFLESISEDPRAVELGFRLLCRKENAASVTRLFSEQNLLGPSVYSEWRRSFGVAEGVDDIPSGKSFPFESNFDLMHGVSLKKGCYMGQELTAASYFKGATRKRLMPIVVTPTSPNWTPPPVDSPITDQQGRAVGKLRGLTGTHGIGLVRLQYFQANSDRLEGLHLADNTKCIAFKPEWWKRAEFVAPEVSKPPEAIQTDL